jgi:two-component sensor histidine kinase
VTPPPPYTNNPKRLATLAGYEILDTPPEPGFDDIAQLAMQICETPVALVSLVAGDRQWFKARIGFEASETNLESSVCAHALIEPDLLIIPDLTLDARTRRNPLVTGEPRARFYAGAPLRAGNGEVLGSLCVLDSVPRPAGLTAGQASALRNLARQVITQLELRRALRERDQFLAEQRKAESRRNALLDLGDGLRDVATIAEMTRVAAAIVGLTLGAIRAGFGTLDANAEFLDVEADWTSPGYRSAQGRHRLADYGELVPGLLRGEPVIIHDVPNDPRTAANAQRLLGYGIQSLLNMPVREHGRTVALFFVHAGEPRQWPPEIVTFLRNAADRVEAGVARLKAEAEQRVLNLELSHRMKNTLALVQAIAGQTLRDVPEQAPVKSFMERIQALSTAHDVLLGQSWVSAGLRDVITTAIDRLQSRELFELSGPAVVVGPRAVISLSLLIHELATNAAKYGAFTSESGRVLLSWRIEDDDLIVVWRERGGPAPVVPSRTGFGFRLLNMGIAGTGGTELRYPAGGFEAEFKAPLAALLETN